jgi:peptide deformylase
VTTRPIVKFPDPRLKLVAAPVTAFDDELRALASDLLDTMRAAPGIGITAPHVGIARRVVVLELEGPGSARTYVNPGILWTSEETIPHTEGSVSMPGVTDEIRRHARVRIGYQDLQASNAPKRRRACSPSATSTRSTSWTACSGSSGCRN